MAGFKKQMDYTKTNVGAKVQPHIHSISIVFPAQMLKYLQCVTMLGLWCLWFIMRRLLIKMGKGNWNEMLFRYPSTCILLQPSSPSYPGSHKRVWTTLATSFNMWLYCGSSHHGPRSNQNTTTLPGCGNVKTFSINFQGLEAQKSAEIQQIIALIYLKDK